jgi:uncharacterized membrane protein YdbT with pleckstrin-like domain
MAYPPENLHHDEQLVLDLRPHWWTYTPSLLALIAAVAFGVWVLIATDSDAMRIIAALVVLVGLVWFVARYVQWATTELVLTTDRLIYRSGVIAKSGIEIPIDRINTIFFNQRIWERLVGVGDLTVESASATGAKEFMNMKRPARIQNEIYIQKEELEHRRRRRAAAPLSAEEGSGDDVADRIMQLNELRAAGAISEDEYQTKKAELLNRM